MGLLAQEPYNLAVLVLSAGVVLWAMRLFFEARSRANSKNDRPHGSVLGTAPASALAAQRDDTAKVCVAAALSSASRTTDAGVVARRAPDWCGCAA